MPTRWQRIKCTLGFHRILKHLGQGRRTCAHCKAVWYTDWFESRERGVMQVSKVIGNDGRWLPEMTTGYWKVHEYDMPYALVKDKPDA